MPKSESSNNPFSKFSAPPSTSTTSGGWLNTKRIGRDDDAIERDRKLALDARRARNSRGGGQTKKRNGPSPKKRRGKKGRVRVGDSTSEGESECEFDDEEESSDESEASFQDDDDEDSDDDDDVDDFIVDSDESVDVVGSSDDEGEVSPVRSSPDRKPSCRRQRQKRGLEEIRKAVAAKKTRNGKGNAEAASGGRRGIVGRPIAAPPGRKRFRGRAVFGALGSSDSDSDDDAGSNSSTDERAEVRGKTARMSGVRIPRKTEGGRGGAAVGRGADDSSSSARTTPPSPFSPESSSDDVKKSRYFSSSAAGRRSRSSDDGRGEDEGGGRRDGARARQQQPPKKAGKGNHRPSPDAPSSTTAEASTTVDLCSPSSSCPPEANDDVEVLEVRGKGGIGPVDGVVARAGRETATTTRRRRAILDDEDDSDDHLLDYDAFAPSSKKKPTAEKTSLMAVEKKEDTTTSANGGGGVGTTTMTMMMPQSPSDEEEMVRRAIRESSSASGGAGGADAAARAEERTVMVASSEDDEEDEDDDFRIALRMAKEASMNSSSSSAGGTDPFAESPLPPRRRREGGVRAKKGGAGKDDTNKRRRRIRKRGMNGNGVDVVPTRRGRDGRGGGGGRSKSKSEDGCISSPIKVDDGEEPEVLSVESDDHDDAGDDGENDESYVVDSDEEEANCVLDEANELSARVMDAMTSWASCPSRGGDGVGGGAPVRGAMIVDGALAVSEMGGGGGDDDGLRGTTTTKGGGGDGDGSSSWISAEEMERALSPSKIRLADYQLVGVNWMALMHSLRCDLVDTKRRRRRDDNGGRKSGDPSDDDDEDGEYQLEKKRGGGRVRRAKKSSEGKKRGVGGGGGRSNVNGVLADEMGLGKTVQTIAFLAWLKYRNRTGGGRGGGFVDADAADAEDSVAEEKKGDDDDDVPSSSTRRRQLPHIIVVPASVLSNWEREFRVVCPSMRVVRYHGSMKEREEIKAELLRSSSSSDAEPFDVLLTTYSYFSTERGDDRNFLRRNFNFDYMVVDEAHCLKNPRGARYRNLDMMNTEHRLLLTGTPVQNSPQELMSLLCFLMPLFAPRTTTGGGANGFEEKKENDGGARMLEHFITIENKKKKDPSSTDDSGNGEDEAQVYRKLKLLLAPFILRRRKCDVSLQGLPPKIRKVEFVPFDEASRKVYESLLSSHINKSRRGTDVVGSESTVKNLFTALRKAANHPLLLRTRHTNEEAVEDLSSHFYQLGFFGRDSTCTKDMVRRELAGFSDFDVHCASLELMEEYPHVRKSLEKYTLDSEDLFCSPKFVRLRTMLPRLIEDGHRILIFSQWTKCLDLLGCLLEYMGLQSLRFDGQINVKERQALIDRFNNDASIPIFLLSTRAGGMGINLTSADTCILHDLDFNPFNDLQAEDRVHRMGQTKQVTVYKMVTEGTVDADIYAMQERKAKMNAAIFEQEKGAKEKAQSKDNDKNEMSAIVQTAVERFMLSPTGNTKEE